MPPFRDCCEYYELRHGKSLKRYLSESRCSIPVEDNYHCSVPSTVLGAFLPYLGEINTGTDSWMTVVKSIPCSGFQLSPPVKCGVKTETVFPKLLSVTYNLLDFLPHHHHLYSFYYFFNLAFFF